MLNTDSFCSSDASTPNTYADSYAASSSGGCFTTKKAKYCTGKKALYGNMYGGAWSGRPYDVTVLCNTCGQYYGSSKSSEGGYEGLIASAGQACTKVTGYTYTRSCGKTNGEIVWQKESI